MSLEKIIFRPAQPDDLGQVMQMTKALYHVLGAPNEYMSDKKITATFQQLHRQPDHLRLEVFEIDGVIVGYALLFKFWYNEYGGMVLNIDELFIKPDFRSLGISTRYLSELASRRDDTVALALEVLPENKKAYSLYKRVGFQEKETVTLHRILK